MSRPTKEIEELDRDDWFWLTWHLASICIAAKKIQECFQDGNLPGIVIWNQYISKKIKQIMSL